MAKGRPILIFVNHSATVLNIAAAHGWLPGARYTNLRDVRKVKRLGFLDIDWKNYDFQRHIEAASITRPLVTVARDIECKRSLRKIVDQAYRLKEYAEHVILVPKDPLLASKIGTLPAEFLMGYSVPSRYGATSIAPEAFNRPVHLLGGRPDVQRHLATRMPVFSIDANRFTLDAAFGDYFDGDTFRPHPEGGYHNCLKDSVKNITALWADHKIRKQEPCLRKTKTDRHF
jgi:hypothetical protein